MTSEQFQADLNEYSDILTDNDNQSGSEMNDESSGIFYDRV